MDKAKSLSVVIPVYNEEENLPELIRRCIESCDKTELPYEIILVDDGSSDNSAEIINDAAEKNDGRIIAIQLNRNYGQHAAVMTGFENARGELVITLDADLQNPPEEIPRLVKTANEGYDVVGTVRVPREDSIFRKVSSYLVNKIVQKTTGVMMHDYGCMLRAYRADVVRAMLSCRESSTFIPALANNFAGKTTEIEVQHAERTAGDSKYSLWKLINLQFDLLTSITTFPLRLLSVLGVIIAVAGGIFGVLLIILRIIYGPEWAAEGVFSLFAILFIFIGAQFIGLGLLGEYIGRIYDDVRARPRSFIKKISGKSRLEK